MASTSRRQPASHLTPHAKPIISVEEWEAKAPLGDVETRSVNIVKVASEHTPLPQKVRLYSSYTRPQVLIRYVKFSGDDYNVPSRPSSPALRGKLHPGLVASSSSRPSTPSPFGVASPHTSNRPPTTHALHPKHPIQTPQQFYDWFALIDRSVAHSQEAHFRAHLSSVAEHLETCEALLKRIDDVDTEVSGMLQAWRSVEDGGKSLKDACEQLLEERVRSASATVYGALLTIWFVKDNLINMTEAIGERLEYFQELEQATRMLNHPGESLVLQTDFLYMVERVDICIEYLKAHVRPFALCRRAFDRHPRQRHFREAELYLLRFQQCMTRAMTLIKMYFVGSLRALTADISRRMSERVSSCLSSSECRVILFLRTCQVPRKLTYYTPAL